MKAKVVKWGRRDQGRKERLEVETEGAIMQLVAVREANISNETRIMLPSTQPAIQ